MLWICNKLSDVGDNKVTYYCHVIGKYRSYANWSCNINFKMNEEGLVIFHNSKGYDSNLIIKEIGKFDVKVLYQMDSKGIWPLQLIEI